MATKHIRLYSYIESPTHPLLHTIYPRLGIEHQPIKSLRKVMQQLKKATPDILIAEFFYGYSNNYAGANISNLDVLLRNMQQKMPEVKLVIIASKQEAMYVEKLLPLFPIAALVTHPVTPNNLGSALSDVIETL
jgi:DNA-binding NarL/FixJ family response regulator